jgi:hypothetical protein
MHLARRKVKSESIIISTELRCATKPFLILWAENGDGYYVQQPPRFAAWLELENGFEKLHVWNLKTTC